MGAKGIDLGQRVNRHMGPKGLRPFTFSYIINKCNKTTFASYYKMNII